MLLHSMALCIMVCCAMALFTVLWPCFAVLLLQGWGKINLCSIGYHGGVVVVILALFVVVFFA